MTKQSDSKNDQTTRRFLLLEFGDGSAVSLAVVCPTQIRATISAAAGPDASISGSFAERFLNGSRAVAVEVTYAGYGFGEN